MENIKKYIRYKNAQFRDSDGTYKSLFSIICDQGDRIFCEYFDMLQPKKVTYKEFKEISYLTGGYFQRKLKSYKDSFVGIYMENSINWVATFWALLMIGYKPLLLNCKLPDSINQEIIELMNCNEVIVNEKVSLPKLNSKFISYPSQQQLSECDYCDDSHWADEIAICTTASSLNYKICVYAGREMTNQLMNAKYIIDKCPSIKLHYKHRLKLLAFLPFYHIFGLVATYLWFASFGRTIVILKDYSADTILNTINYFEVTHIFSVPLFWNTIAHSILNVIDNQPPKIKKKFLKGQKLSIKLQQAFPKLGLKIARRMFKQIINRTLGNSIQFIITGGGNISDTTLKLFNSLGYPLRNGYGSSELGILTLNMSSKIKSRMAGGVGDLLPTYTARIEDGKLLINSSSAATYVIRRDKTKESICNTWFDTQDEASCVNGEYFINGRKDDVFVNENGEKINPDLVEKKMDFTTVKNFVVIAYKKKLCLIIQLADNLTKYDIHKVIEEVKANCDKVNHNGYNIQNVYYTYDPIANANAIKVSRRILYTLLDNNKVKLNKFSELNKIENISDEKINNDIVNQIKEIIAPILNKKVSELKSNKHLIFDLGISSIEYMTCLIRLQKEFNLTFDFKEHSCTTIDEFANYILAFKKGEKNDGSK